jgi:regulator of sigma E protease
MGPRLGRGLGEGKDVTIIESVAPFVAIIVVLIVVHEFGHFMTARLAGARVLEFGLGYPPRLWATKRGDTEYSINALPLGGFVRILGEEDPSDPRSLASRPRAWRLLVLSAGSMMNFLFAIALFSAGLMIPREVPIGRAVVQEVMPGSPAKEAGVEPGDIIWKINGREVKNVPETGEAIRLNLGETVTMRVKRQSEFLDLRVRARWAAPDIVHVVAPGEDVETVAKQLGLSTATVRDAAGIKTTLDPGQQITIGEGPDAITYVAEKGDTAASVAQRLGVSQEAVRIAAGLPDPNKLEAGQELRIAQGPTGIIIAAQYPFTESQSYSLFKAVPLGLRSTIDSLTLARNEVISWIKGGGSPEVSGPIGIAQATGEVVKEVGWKVLVDFAALLSVNLAVINILPLPMLDGGRIVFVLLEVLRGGRRVAPQKEALVHLVGLVALLTLVVVISYFDIVRIIQGGSIFR